jgi:hypothetical protein
MKGENNADLIKQMRILQELFYDVTDNDLFARTNEIIQIMEMASKDIHTNFEEVSRSLTEMMNGKDNTKNNKSINEI